MRYALILLLLFVTPTFAVTPTIGTTSIHFNAAQDTMRVARPSGLGSGDLCLIFCISDQNNPGSGEHDQTATDLTFMGEIAGSSEDIDVSAHYWTGGAPPDSFKVAMGATGRFIMIAIEVLNPHATPIEFTTAGVLSTTTTLAITGTSTTNDSVLAFYLAGFDGADLGGPTIDGAGWSEYENQRYGSGGNGITVSWGTNPIEDNGATGTITVTWGATDGSAGLQVGIRGGEPGAPADEYEGTVIIIGMIDE